MSDNYYKLEGGQQGTRSTHRVSNFLSRALRKRIDGLFLITIIFVVFSILLSTSMVINILVLSFQLIHTGAVACDVSNCSQMGLEAMDKGGSAVDAAIVTMLCMGLYSPQYSGIGGGGFMVVFNNAKDMTAFDFRERAPLAATRDMFVGKPKNASEKGGLSVAVPGDLRGMEEAHKKYGRYVKYPHSYSFLLYPN